MAPQNSRFPARLSTFSRSRRATPLAPARCASAIKSRDRRCPISRTDTPLRGRPGTRTHTVGRRNNASSGRTRTATPRERFRATRVHRIGRWFPQSPSLPRGNSSARRATAPPHRRLRNPQPRRDTPTANPRPCDRWRAPITRPGRASMARCTGSKNRPSASPRLPRRSPDPLRWRRVPRLPTRDKSLQFRFSCANRRARPRPARTQWAEAHLWRSALAWWYRRRRG